VTLTGLRPSRRFALTLVIALAVLAGDALSKRAVQQTLDLAERRELIPGLLVITHVRNTGAAYGLLTGHRWLLVLTAAAVAAATPLLLRSLPIHGRWAWSGPVLTGFILGGAIGNLIERARNGYVTDFIQVPPIRLFQVFNLSDACISVAIVALVLISLFGGEETRPAPRREPEAQVDANRTA
jgi:signal peptidase II